MHGANSSFVRLAERLGVKFEEKEWPDWWYFGGERKLLRDDDVDEEVDKVRKSLSFRASYVHVQVLAG